LVRSSWTRSANWAKTKGITNRNPDRSNAHKRKYEIQIAADLGVFFETLSIIDSIATDSMKAVIIK
jgi:hypothetical protein